MPMRKVEDAARAQGVERYRGGDTAAAKGEGPWMMMTMDAEDGCVLLVL